MSDLIEHLYRNQISKHLIALRRLFPFESAEDAFWEAENGGHTESLSDAWLEYAAEIEAKTM